MLAWNLPGVPQICGHCSAFLSSVTGVSNLHAKFPQSSETSLNSSHTVISNNAVPTLPTGSTTCLLLTYSLVHHGCNSSEQWAADDRSWALPQSTGYTAVGTFLPQGLQTDLRLSFLISKLGQQGQCQCSHEDRERRSRSHLAGPDSAGCDEEPGLEVETRTTEIGSDFNCCFMKTTPTNSDFQTEKHTER